MVYFLGAGHKQIVILLSPTVARLFAFNLICAQSTVPVDAITVLLKRALPFCRNGMSAQRLFNVRKAVLKCAKHCNVSSVLRFRNRHVSVTVSVAFSVFGYNLNDI